jgi:ATP-binding cassette subfamily F protein uup
MDVGYLSGGEQNRVLLAKLFTRSSNLLVLDEPTNDLDLETLDLLEEMLVTYTGTVLLVTHDREFLDRVVTSSLVLAGDGTVQEFAGGYSDWADRVRWSTSTTGGSGRGGSPGPRVRDKGATTRSEGDASGDGASSGRGSRPRDDRPRKLSYKETRELETLPDRIADLEHEIASIEARLADPELYKGDGEAVRELTQKLERMRSELDAAFARWEELDAIAHASE